MSETMIRLSPLELAIDTAIGLHESEPPLPETDPDLDPLAALEQAVLPGLRRPPCVVSFSGGRDSSAILAVVTNVARRQGLPLPVALTQRFPTFPDTDESRWQELVIRHLRLDDWQRQTFTTELNLLGPAAQSVIRRHGIVGPTGAHQLVPMLSEAGHGTLVTGIDGDGLFGGGAFARVRAVLAGRIRPVPRDALTLLKRGAPAPLRRARAARQIGLVVPWLRPGAASSLREVIARELAGEPLLWSNRIRWWARLRYHIAGRQVLEMLAADANVLVLHPLLDARFLAALAARGGALGYGDRTHTMRCLFGHLLPAALLTRADKADFTRMCWSQEARAFAEHWNGVGVPADIVDPEALRREWAADMPDARSGLLLQAAWAAASGVGLGKQQFNCSF